MRRGLVKVGASIGLVGGIASLVTAALMTIGELTARFGPLVPQWFFPVLYVFFISIAVIAIGGSLAFWGLATESPVDKP